MNNFFSGLAALLITGFAILPVAAFADTELTPDVASSLILAESHIKSKQFNLALSDIEQATKKAKTLNDRYVTLQTKAAAYSISGDNKNALQADIELSRSPETSVSQKKTYLAAIVGLAYKTKNYSTCQKAALSLLDIDYTAIMATMAIQCPYIAQDWEQVVHTVPIVKNLAQKQHAQQIPENVVQMDAIAQGKLKRSDLQNADYLWLAANYPKKQYWDLALHGLIIETDLSPREIFMLDRLRYATHTLPADMNRDMLEQAIQLQLPLLAEKLSSAMATIPNKTAEDIRFQKFIATEAQAAKASLPLATKSALQSSTAGEPLTVGYELVLNGETKKGLSLMRDGLAKGPHHPDEAKLSYALAEMDAGLRQQAKKDLLNIPGSGVAYRLGQLWSLFLHN